MSATASPPVADPLAAVDARVNAEAIGRDGLGCHSGADTLRAAASAAG